MYLKEVDCKDVNWNEFVENVVCWYASLIMVMNLQVP
jgi:hypothetical protein